MKKTFIIIISAITLVVIFVATYYFLVLIPQKQKQEQEKQAEHIFSKRQECQELGQKYYKDIKDRLSKDTLLSLPQYAYNERLNTCLIFYMSWGEASGSNIVRDILSNEALLIYTYIIIDDKKTSLLTENGETITHCKENCTFSDNALSKFDEKKAELFNQ